MQRLVAELRTAWAGSAPLTATFLIMLADLLLCVAGLAADDRTITGSPAWLKPAKFAVSVALFSGTLAWLFRYIATGRRFARALGWVIAVSLLIEIAIIDVQAFRGTASHFNVGTALDGILFSIMGATIALFWLASAALFVVLCRQRFENPEWGWWVRMGLFVTVVGSAGGGLMTRPTPEQLEAMQSGSPAAVVGAHTVGAPDGGPGLPGTGWSTEHGDLRPSHFLALHGLQTLPLIGWLSLRRSGSRKRRHPAAPAAAAALSYAGITSILMWQALRGQSIVSPDGATGAALAIWLLATLAGAVILARRPNGDRSLVPRTTA